MTESQLIEIGLGFLGSVFAVIGWLLKGKDASQEKELETLWKKLDTVTNDLQEHKLSIAEGHYKKPELDSRFSKLEETIKHGFDGMGEKFDKLSDALMAHINFEDRRSIRVGDQ